MTDDLSATAGENFEAWREAVGFEEGFPRLPALLQPAPPAETMGIKPVPGPDARRFFFNQIHREKAFEIYESIGGSARVVLNAPGHGTTTLARLIHQLAEEQAMIRRAIPVLLTVEDLLDNQTYDSLLQRSATFLEQNHPRLAQREFDPRKPDLTEVSDPQERVQAQAAYKQQLQDHHDDLIDAADDLAKSYFGTLTVKVCQERIEAAIRTAVVRSLATRRWERVLRPALYRDIVGSVATDRRAFEEQRGQLAPHIMERHINWLGVAQIAPKLGNPDYQELIRDLNKASHVRISLILDLSATPVGRLYLGEAMGEYFTSGYSKLIQNVAKAIKNIEQQSSIGPQPVLPSLLDKTYFLSQAAFHMFTEAFAAQEVDKIEFPPYRPVDLWAILAQHYPPNLDENGRRSEVLAAVLDSSFIEITPEIGISTEMAILEAQLRDELAKERDLRYHRRAATKRDVQLIEVQQKLEKMRASMEEELRKLRLQVEGKYVGEDEADGDAIEDDE